MSMTLLLLTFIIFIVILALAFICITLKRGTYLGRPYRYSLIVMSLVLMHWILVLTHFYTLLPNYISDFLFLPIWYFLCILGFIVCVKEWRNNRIVSICVSVFSFINFLFGMLLQAISNM
ncbi:hypothetical protein [Bacillus cytotoxicus]|nr:hypothetical protein [Bacillus cytotoxicus]AWC28332.1 hypothetical protein CG483_008060 [Bacillus cytotoxicus]AWC40283.1 hypothetical protein CG480_007190 [Bacillus cytotoxicus]AWC44415.1 hypothetical protein CG479_007680 [Bacillus cytotoxicus]AWC48214.1 hypothetical protein CG478_007190 [Bacillus cytotoxicus]AWC52399.1 hypothetical protein CG477_008020 [Bacillus cytotoxicus]